MEITITYNQKDIIALVESLLMHEGLKPIAPIVFQVPKDKSSRKGSKVIEEYEIKVSCTASDLPRKCPVCGTNRYFAEAGNNTSKTAVSPTVTSPNVTVPIVPPPTLDVELGESSEPPDEITSTNAKTDNPNDATSIHALVAQSKRFAKERKDLRVPSPKLMRGEFTKPPKY